MTPFQKAFYFIQNEREKSTLENHFIDFKEQLNIYHEQYSLTLQSYSNSCELELEELDKALNRRLNYFKENNTTSEEFLEFRVDKLHTENHDSKLRVKEKYFNYFDLYSKSILISLFSLNEIYLNKICDTSSKHERIKLSDFNFKNNLYGPIKYLELVLNIDISIFDKQISKLEDIQFLRNKIIHEGTLDESEKLKSILSEHEGKLEFDKNLNFFKILHPQFIFDIEETLKAFYSKLFWALEANNDNMTITNSLKLWFGLIDENIYITNVKQCKSSVRSNSIKFCISSKSQKFTTCKAKLTIKKSKISKVELINQTTNELIDELFTLHKKESYELIECLNSLIMFNTSSKIEMLVY